LIPLFGKPVIAIFSSYTDSSGDNFDAGDHIDSQYGAAVSIQYSSVIVNKFAELSLLYLQQKRENFCKFLVDRRELDLLKQDSTDSNNLCKAAGKPRSGPIFDRRNLADYCIVKDFQMNNRLKRIRILIICMWHFLIRHCQF